MIISFMEAIRIFPMFSVSIIELLTLVLFALIVMYPWAMIVEKADKSKLLAIPVFIPLEILILPWYLALTEWKRYRHFCFQFSKRIFY